MRKIIVAALVCWAGIATATEGDNWPAGGRDQEGTYYSPLAKINNQNVGKLGFAWAYDLGTYRGQEATPIVIDGVMYTSGTWGYVYAVNAATGKEIWRYDPQAAHLAARHPCCDLVNRGVAVWKGRVYVASVDGRLHAIDAATGKKVWEADTVIDHNMPYSSTGAPQIAGHVVVIGNSGADMGHGGVRGYVSAYDLDTGAFKWRVFTVPPDPGHAAETPAIEAAAKTWDAPRDKQYKLGGTAWDGFAYDPTLDLVYFGTANAAPYDSTQFGPSYRDELYTASILAVQADTGQLAWYYQTTPARSLGLRCRPEVRHGGPARGWQAPPGSHAGQQERLLLRVGPQVRRAAVRATITPSSTGRRAWI